MPTVKRVESQIRKCERFAVRILRDRDYRDVRGDRKGLLAYPFDRAAKGAMRVGAWEKRFSTRYPGLRVEVLKSNGVRADGRMNIGTVREGYESK
jgi:hypothetical protein